MTMGKHLVLAGGGHAHMTTLIRLGEIIARGHSATLVSLDAHQYYSGMGPGMLGGFYRPQDIRFNVARTVEARGGRFIRGRVVAIDPVAGRVLVETAGLTEGQGRPVRLELDYDVLSCNVGSTVPTDIVARNPAGTGGDVLPVKPVRNLLLARQRLLALAGERDGVIRVVVVGGGPAGFEVAGNVRQVLDRAKRNADVTVVAGRQFLNGFPERARCLARRALARRGVSIVEGNRAVRLADGWATLESGRRLGFDLALLAVGVEPPDLFAGSGLPVGATGGLAVNRCLQSVGCPDIFGGGDCIDFQDRPLDKVGVYAVRQNPILYHNLLARLEGRELREFRPGGRYLLVCNNGDGTGILARGRLAFDGRTAFVIKDILDRRFMRRFQVSGETWEPF
jgi:NADH dehydrogenase FAD-containing subunit